MINRWRNGFAANTWARTVALVVGCLALSTDGAWRPIPAPKGNGFPIFLGGTNREWAIFDGKRPYGSELRFQFEAKRNDREHTLFIRQDDVKQDWAVVINGKKIGSLFLMEADLIHTLAIPSGLLRDGENEIQITNKAADDILIHALTIGDDAKTNLLKSGLLQVEVRDSKGGGLPSRITIVDTNGSMAALSAAGEIGAAIRPGVAYAAKGIARVNLLPGKYTVYATRGPEYSLGESAVTVSGGPAKVILTLDREVNTEGWFCSDTHIHTLALSKHGDSLLGERMITIAGEGIELPIATEHNQHADYKAAAAELGLLDFFTPVAGNEVTTSQGHFNLFPVLPGAPAVDHTKADWPGLLGRIREQPEVRMVILNHPTDTHNGFTPFAATNFNRLTGKNLRGNFEFTFDGMELINSGAMRTDWMEPIRAWFALLNRGYRIVGVGSSDCHDVSRFIVGQGRTYIRGDDSNAGKLDVAKACEALKEGRAVVSYGLFPQFRITDAPDALDAPHVSSEVVSAQGSGPGDLHRGGSPFFEVHGSVDFPAWMNREGRTTVTVYGNGKALTVFPFDMVKRPGQPLAFKARFPKPKVDTWYVLVAETPGMTNAYWGISRPYQPSSPEWNPTMIGVTNPVWMDADGDGRFTSPRETAQRLVERARPDAEEGVLKSLAEVDWATAVQAAEILHDSGTTIADETFQEQLKSAPLQVQQGFGDYLNTSSK